jgi:hypothetical protein
VDITPNRATPRVGLPSCDSATAHTPSLALMHRLAHRICHVTRRRVQRGARHEPSGRRHRRFLASLPLVLVGLFIRLKVAESPAFAHARETGVHVRQPIVEVLRWCPRQVLLSAGVRLIDTVRGHRALVGRRQAAVDGGRAGRRRGTGHHRGELAAGRDLPEERRRGDRLSGVRPVSPGRRCGCPPLRRQAACGVPRAGAGTCTRAAPNVTAPPGAGNGSERREVRGGGGPDARDQARRLRPDHGDGGVGLAPTIVGMIDASATRRPVSPRTRSS